MTDSVAFEALGAPTMCRFFKESQRQPSYLIPVKIRTEKLTGRYLAAGKAIADAGHDLLEEIAFHGTPAVNIPAIIEDGFRISGLDGTKGAVFGPGVYLTNKAITATAYCNGDNRILVCLVLLGRHRDTPEPDSRLLAPGRNQYDSVAIGQFLVPKCADQVLPLFTIECEVDQKAANEALSCGKDKGLPYYLKKLPKHNPALHCESET